MNWGDSSRTERNYVIHFFYFTFSIVSEKERQRCAILHCGLGPCRAYVISVGNTTSQMFFQVKCTNGWMVVEQCQKIHLEQCLILGE